ncbi:type VI secretion protein [Ruminococcaceae bacterium OttesenSCG-928-D13]|nr:type VI secretion protein [Ruminococcaceae bacterium OttesenSCG-928-D13]
MALELDPATRAQDFRETNGRVLRTVNILRTDYTPVHDVISAVMNQRPYLTEGNLRDSFNYLQLAGYVELQYIKTKEPIKRIAQVNLHELEAILSVKGIRLLSGSETDPDVIV